jgi:transglutaminase-like putative cysteine protease
MIQRSDEADRFIDHDDVDWDSVVAVTYQIDQSIRYDYDFPITDLAHRLVITPRDMHGDQRRISHSLTVTPDARSRSKRDGFGNEIVDFAVARVEHGISFTLQSEVVRDRRLGTHIEAYVPQRSATLGVRRLVRLDEALVEAGADLRSRYPRLDERAEAIVRYVHREMIYTKSVTDIFTTASVAFQMRRGVCQDYAHIAVALACAAGVSARYVSGHLLGEGATHAWVEFLIPRGDGSAQVMPFDPTVGRATDWRYIVVAVGRDYEDVAPSSGVFTGAPTGRLGQLQAVRLTSITLAA